MKDLAVRLAALDPDAGAALRVIAYFDRLTEARAGLQTIVRGAAVLAGCPARLVDDTRRIQMRVQPDGSAAPAPPAAPTGFPDGAAPPGAAVPPSEPGAAVPPYEPGASRARGESGIAGARGEGAAGPRGESGAAAQPGAAGARGEPGAAAAPDGSGVSAAPGGLPDPAWMSVAVGGATLWLERTGPPGPVEAMVLERASAAVKAVLDRTRAHPPRSDPALVELVVDAEAAEPERLRAASRLGLQPSDRVRAVALADGSAALIAEAAEPPTGRAGVGPAGPVAALPESWAAARVALRFTAEGTEQDPGRRVVHADELGGLALLAAAVGPGTEPVPDVRSLDRAAATAPWMLTTLDAVAEAASLRAAATALRVHHSTLQDRLAHAMPVLGWDVREPRGRLRLQVALALRRLHRGRP